MEASWSVLERLVLELLLESQALRIAIITSFDDFQCGLRPQTVIWEVPGWRTTPPDFAKNLLKTSCSDTETFGKPLVFFEFWRFSAFRSLARLGSILEAS